MIDLSSFSGFSWDRGNKDKSYEKHGITTRESEEIFLDEKLQVQPDAKHSQDEKRFIAIGNTSHLRILFVIFTFRDNNVRIISARLANQKERSLYEKAIKTNS